MNFNSTISQILKSFYDILNSFKNIHFGLSIINLKIFKNRLGHPYSF